MLTDNLKVLDRVVTVLERLGIRYVVGGSVASGARAEWRATNDIDILCEFTNETLSQFVDTIEGEFYIDRETAFGAFRSGRSFNAVHHETIIKVDIFTKICRFEQIELERATPLEIPGCESKPRIATTEDIIFAKLRWYHSGGQQSERLWRDLINLMTHNRDKIDWDYLEETAALLQLEQLLTRLKTSV